MVTSAQKNTEVRTEVLPGSTEVRIIDRLAALMREELILTESVRSPFGALLREERRAMRISQAELASRIQERFNTDPSVAELGVVSDRAIANIEAAKPSAAEFVRPKPETVAVIMLALGIDPKSERGKAMLRAAERTTQRKPVIDASAVSRNSLPFVHGGRRDQWDSLVQAWEEVKTGRPAIRLISGSAGSGKTRLVEEFTSFVRSDVLEVLITWGECSSGAASIEPYLPFRQAISSVLRLEASDGERSSTDEPFARLMLDSFRKLGNVLLDYNDLKSWLAARTPKYLSELEGMRDSFSPTETAGRFDQLMIFGATIAKVVPIVLVLEDLHWADESSCSLLLYAQRQIRNYTDMPVLIIGTYRASDLAVTEDRHPLSQVINEMGRQMDTVVLELDASVGEEYGLDFVREMVGSFNLSPTDNERLSAALYSRTEGHPLFTTELLQRLVANGVLEPQTNQTWKLTGDDLNVDLPNRIRAVLKERFDRLPENERTLVEAASVQGTTFTTSILPAVTGLDEDVIDTLLDRQLTERHQMVTPAPTSANPCTYTFRHALTAEYVYSTLSPRRRLSLHRRTAEAVLNHYAGQLFVAAPIAAWHFKHANMPVEAARQALEASFGALAKLDYDLTMVWVEFSEDLALESGDTGLLWEARIRRAHALRGLGQLQEANRLSHEAIAYARREPDSLLEAQALDIISQVALDQGRLQDAIEAMDRGLALYEANNRSDRMSANLSMLSHAVLRLGRIDLALEMAEAAWSHAPDQYRDGFGAEALLAKGNVLMELGQYRQALEQYSTSRTIYETTGEIRGSLLTRMNSAHCMARLDMHEDAQEIFEALEQEATQLRTPRLLAYIYFYQAQSFEAIEDFHAAIAAYRHALRTRREGGLDSMAGDDLAGMLRAAIGLNDRIDVRLADLERWWRSHDPMALEDPLLAILSFARGYQATGQEDQMLSCIREGVRMFRRRCKSIRDSAIREMYEANQCSGVELERLAKKAGLVIGNDE